MLETLTAREPRFAHVSACFHGGAFFDAIGVEFDRLERRRRVVNADVLDAWFPPSPRVIEALRRELPWLLRTSPPTRCEGLVRVLSRVRGVPEESIVCGAGSSDLIFRALPRWLSAKSRALVVDPSYGEYAHVLEQVVGCRVERFRLAREDGWEIDLERLATRVERGRHDLLVLVNPNNPTGRHLPRARLEPFLRELPARTRAWIDEAYVDYVDPAETLEPFAAAARNVVVCKSLSKAFALSGARAAYLVGAPSVAGELRRITPPWTIGLASQVAAIAALSDPDWYSRCRARTRALREKFADRLGRSADRLGFAVDAALANWVLLHLEDRAPAAGEIVARCARRNVFLRDAGATSAVLGPRVLRIAVRREGEQRRILAALESALTH